MIFKTLSRHSSLMKQHYSIPANLASFFGEDLRPCNTDTLLHIARFQWSYVIWPHSCANVRISHMAIDRMINLPRGKGRLAGNEKWSTGCMYASMLMTNKNTSDDRRACFRAAVNERHARTNMRTHTRIRQSRPRAYAHICK